MAAARDDRPAPTRTIAPKEFRARRRPPRLRPSAESLEGRALLAAGLALDPGFGVNGVISLVGRLNPVLAAVAQPDGKVVAVGNVQISPAAGPVGEKDEIFAERFNRDGSLDATFGTGGVAYIPITVNGVVQATPKAVTIQPDGKILIVGFAGAPNVTTVNGVASTFPVARTVAAVARLNADGSPDAAFGAGGSTTIDFATPADYAYATVDQIRDEADSVLVQPDGKILVGGGEGIVLYSSSGAIQPPVLARLNADGSLDPSFGVGGKAYPVPPVDPSLRLQTLVTFASLAQEPDGRIVGGGPDALFISVVERMDSHGFLDATFGVGGGVQASGTQVAVQADGKIVVAGTSASRLNLDGSLDTSFVTGGAVFITADRLSVIVPPIIGADGRITLVGTGGSLVAGTFNTFTTTLDEVRFNPDGTLDATFGDGGVASHVVAIDSGMANYGQFTAILAVAQRPADGSLVEFQHPTIAGQLVGSDSAAAYVPVSVPAQVASLTVSRDRRGLESASITFTAPIAQAGAVNPADYAIRLLNRRGKAGPAIRIGRVSYNVTTHVATITPRRPISNGYAVQVTASGKSIVGVNGVHLAGDGQSAGTDFVGVVAKPAPTPRVKAKR